MELACVFSNKVSNLPPPHLHPSKTDFEHQLSMLAPANSPFLIIILFFGKQNVEWKCTEVSWLPKFWLVWQKDKSYSLVIRQLRTLDSEWARPGLASFPRATSLFILKRQKERVTWQLFLPVFLSHHLLQIADLPCICCFAHLEHFLSSEGVGRSILS